MKNQDDIRQVLHIVANDHQFCVRLERVERILSLVALKPVPLSPPFIVGLMTLTGKSVVVIDLAERLGLKDDRPYTIDTPILLCANGNDRLMGLIISEIISIDAVDTNELQLAPTFEEPSSPFEGVINTSRGPSLLLNVDKVMPVNVMAEETDIRFSPDVVSESMSQLQA